MAPLAAIAPTVRAISPNDAKGTSEFTPLGGCKPDGPPGALPRINSVTAITWVSILNLAFFDALIVKPSAAAMERRPVTANSRPMMITIAHAGANLFSTRDTSAAEISNLSAIGSRRIPRVETCPRRLAIYPSAQSVTEAPTNNASPINCWGRPSQSVANLVNKTTTRSGTTNILDRVSAFGRFKISFPESDSWAQLLQPKWAAVRAHHLCLACLTIFLGCFIVKNLIACFYESFFFRLHLSDRLNA